MNRFSPHPTTSRLSRSACCGYIVLWSVVVGFFASIGAATAGAAHRHPSGCDRAAARRLNQSEIVRVTPVGSVNGLVDGAPEGTTFCLQPGVYRLSQPVVPKTGDTFVGSKGTVISGAVALKSFTRSGNAYVASGLSGFNPNHVGYCRHGVSMCQYANDVYFDNRPLRRVAALSALGPGKVYVDESAGTAYLADNPAGHTVEFGLTRQAFTGGAENVTLQGLTVEKFANEGQVPAVASRYNWSILKDEIRLNHGIGVSDAGLMSGSFIHDNGEMGIAMSYISAPAGKPFRVIGNDISRNNYAGYDPNWEGGCCKFVRVDGLLVSGNYVHDNLGKGLWTDGNNVNVVFEKNRIIDNQYNGINHELSYNAIIRDNDIEGNGFGTLSTSPLQGAAIALSNSCCTEIYGNTIKGNRDGIGLIQADREPGPLGAYVTQRNSIHDNVITLSRRGATGMIADASSGAFDAAAANRFFANTYVLHCDVRPFVWLDGHLARVAPLSASAWKAVGNDAGAKISQSC